VRVPRYQGRRGHPIWFSRQLIAEFLNLPENGAARDIVRSYAAQTEFLDAGDAGILADIDDAAAYGRLTGAPL
jgi:molybdenum cofactor cytidylyltransferase